MSKATDDLTSLILEHERAIENYEQRIESLWRTAAHDPEPQTLLIVSQLEFFALNVRTMKHQREQELENLIRMERYQEDHPRVPNIGAMTTDGPRPFTILGPPPEGDDCLTFIPCRLKMKHAGAHDFRKDPDETTPS